MTSGKNLLLLFSLILTAESGLLAASFRLRAREHFDTVWILYTDQSVRSQHTGIGPNINFWLEEAYNYSIGLSYSHMFIDNVADGGLPGIGDKMELIKWGIEYKFFWSKGEGGPFTRLGGSTNTLKTKGTWADLQGSGVYLGLGWEFKFSNIGLALETAGRRVFLDNNIEINSHSPSIGVHFYGYI